MSYMYQLPRVFDADTHINEPVDLWTSRLPRSMGDRAPHVVVVNGKPVWRFPNGVNSITPLMNSAGTPWDKLSPVSSDGYENPWARPSAWDPAARLRDMDADRVYAHALFPSYVLTGSRLFGDDPELHVACVRAYNDWLSEFASYCPERLVGVALVPTTDVDHAVEEVERVAGLPGIRAVMLTAWPNGSRAPQLDVDDRFYAAVADSGLALTIHVGFDEAGEGTGESKDGEQQMGEEYWTGSGGVRLARSNNSKLGTGIFPVLGVFVLGGILDRHPTLRFGVVEVGAGWVPFFLEQTEDALNRHRFWTNTKLPLLPREYWERQCFTTFQIDSYAILNREHVGVHTMMWSSDFPHAGSDWPRSAINIENLTRGVSWADRVKMVADNACAFFGVPTFNDAFEIKHSYAG
jgi:predicted TIM-barrel fold metal-dependent hydrolase